MVPVTANLTLCPSTGCWWIYWHDLTAIAQLGSKFHVNSNDSIRDDRKITRLPKPKLHFKKQEICSVDCLSVLLPKFCENCFPMQIFTKIGQSVAELWPKIIFNTAAVRHLEFLKFSYLVIWLSLSSKSAAVYHISSKSYDFSLRYDDLTIFKRADVRHLEF